MQDRIERSVEIAAPLERVWELVSQPGWWVSEQADPTTDRTVGTVVDIRTAEGHRYPVEVVALRPPEYAAFRWASQFEGVDPVPGRATLIEFTVRDQGDRVLVQVVESGFDAIDASEEIRTAGYADNTSGWEKMLGLLRDQTQG